MVFANSKCNLKETANPGTWVVGLRARLIESGILIEQDNVYKFTSDHIFSSPSAAAAVVLGRKSNGWMEWKYKDGRTLDEVKRQTALEAI